MFTAIIDMIKAIYISVSNRRFYEYLKKNKKHWCFDLNKFDCDGECQGSSNCPYASYLIGCSKLPSMFKMKKYKVEITMESIYWNEVKEKVFNDQVKKKELDDALEEFIKSMKGNE